MSKNIYNNNVIISCPLVHDESGYFYLVYKTTNLVNGKIYIGKHSTKNPYDNYVGSGKAIKQAIEKYGIENFNKEILYCFTNEKEAFLKEEEIVTKEFIDRKDTYNMIVGGYGMKSGEAHPNFGKRGENSHLYGKHQSKETRDKRSKSLSGENNPNYGKHPSQETRDKISKAGKGRKYTQETKDKISRSHRGEKNPMYGMTGENSPMYGKHHTQETKDKITKSLKGMFAGEKNPIAKGVLKINEMGNVVTEYGCITECCNQEHITKYLFYKIIKEHILYNGFYFEYKPKE